jgi:hypothetical protein
MYGRPEPVDILSVDLRHARPLGDRFETRIHALENPQCGARPGGRGLTFVKRAAGYLSNRLDDAERIVLRQHALFHQVMNQTFEKLLIDPPVQIRFGFFRDWRFGAIYIIGW